MVGWLVAASGCFLVGGRAGQSAPKVHSFPSSVQPGLHEELLGLVRNERPFSDKEIRKIAVTEDWGPWFKEGGVEKQAIRASVGVYDAQNGKCWVWNQVFFSRPREGRVMFSVAKTDVNESIAP